MTLPGSKAILTWGNVWHDEVINQGVYLISDFKLRFRGKMSRSSEDANVDVVKVRGILLP